MAQVAIKRRLILLGISLCKRHRLLGFPDRFVILAVLALPTVILGERWLLILLTPWRAALLVILRVFLLEIHFIINLFFDVLETRQRLSALAVEAESFDLTSLVIMFCAC